MVAATSAKNIFRAFREVRQRGSILQKIRDYRGFIDVLYETDEFKVTTAAHGPALLKVLELRHEVFVQEWQGRRAFHGLDVDHHDFCADHLTIIDKKNQKVIGTYRLLSSHFTQDFYSCGEFFLHEFLRIPAVKLEMGRACVHADYRDGRIIDLLWKGLAQYISKSRTEYLFGCTSIKSTSASDISRLLRTLKDQGAWLDELNIRATGNFNFEGIDIENALPLEVSERRILVPQLLRSYIHAGAKVYGYPALDLDFACTDILTILDWKTLNARFQSRFGG